MEQQITITDQLRNNKSAPIPPLKPVHILEPTFNCCNFDIMLTHRHTEYSESSSHNDHPRSGQLNTQHPNAKSTTFRKNDQESQLYVAVRGLQGDLRQNQLADPTVSQSHIFRYVAPLAVFLYFFIIGMTVPRNSAAMAYMAMLTKALGSFGILVAISVLGVGVLLVLVILWALIWPLARVLRSFCEWDVTELNTRMSADKTGDYELSQANMLFGGFLA